MALRPLIYQPQTFDYEHPGIKAASLRAMAEEARGQKLRTDELQRKQEAGSQIRGVVGMYGGKITPKVADEISVIDPTAGMAVNKFLGEQEEQEAKGRREARLAETAELDLNLKKIAHVGGVLNTVQDEASMHRAVGDLLTRDMIPRDLALHYLNQPWTPELQAEIKQAVESTKTTEKQLQDQLARSEEERKVEDQKMQAALHPAAIAKAQHEALIAEQTAKGTKPIQPAEQARLEADKAQAEASAKRQAEQMELTRRGQDITVRGQNMSDVRARDLNIATRANKPPTADELKTGGFYSRAIDAETALSSLHGSMKQKGKLSQLYQKHAPTIAQTDENQSYDQAKRQFITAYLRRDSGAVISSSEFEDADKTFFPQPGEGPERQEQKKRARAVVINTLKVGAGRAIGRFSDGTEPASAVTSAVPGAGQLYNGEKVLKVTRIK